MSRLLQISTLIAAMLGFAGTSVASDAPPPAKASDWLGHVVITRDGKELGTVRDFAIDARSGKVVYIVVSVGSFLIENNLIAVAPDALSGVGSAAGTLRLEADPAALQGVQRFAVDGRWPAAPGVVRTEGASISTPAEPAASEGAAPPPATGTATIESRSKSAHLSASERYIKQTPPPVPEPLPATAAKPTLSKATGTSPTAASTARLEPITKFDHLDKDGDGVLNRSEFAPVISPKDSYSKIDSNANGVIEPQEFDAYEQAHGGAN